MIPVQNLQNPFDAAIVAFPGQPVPADVREIYHLAFDKCREEYLLVAGGQSRSMLFCGEAGCGKTHLLGRFRRWLAGEIDQGPPVRPAVFVAVRMETAPSQVWRHLRQRFAEELLEITSDGTALLDGILARFAARQAGGDPSRAFEEAAIRDLTLDLSKVLEQFSSGKHRRLCRAWLKGETLSDRDLDTLGLGERLEDESDEELAEAAARRFVLAMVRVCSPEPVVFCLDQVEALAISMAPNCYSRFSKMVACLIDETTNALVISSIVSRYLAEFREKSEPADLDRIQKAVQDLQPLDPMLGRKLLEARLEAAPALKPYRPRGGIEPLRAADLDRVFADHHGRCTARKLIHEAHRLFDLWRGASPEPSVPREEFIRRRFAHYREDSPVRSDPTRAEDILAHVLAKAAQLAGRKMRAGGEAGIEFEAQGCQGSVLVALCNHAHTPSLARKLKRLIGQLDREAMPRLRLVRHERLRIPPTAAKTRKYLEELQSAGARLVHPRPEALAALDAMRRLLAEATSGDLTHQGESVAEETVAAWLAANLPAEVSALLDELTGEPEGGPPPPAPDGALLELLREDKVLDAAEAARRLGWTLEQMENHARQNPDSIGFVAGPAAVLFDLGFAPAVGSDRHA